MDARTLSVRTIFGQDRQHVVPLYQRPYVWKRRKQLEPLWDDVRGIAERVVAGLVAPGTQAFLRDVPARPEADAAPVERTQARARDSA